MSRFALCISAALFVACGPVQSSKLLIEAQAELAAAETSQAERLSPFEFVAAEQYLHKAREEQSYAEYELAIRFARKSLDCAKVARARSEASTRAELGAPGTVSSMRTFCLPDGAPREVVPAPTPSAPAEPRDPPSKKKSAPAKEESLPEGDADDRGPR